MGLIADRRNALTIKVTSPDAQVGGMCGKNRNLTSLRFRPGAYRQYKERALEQQLAQVLRLLSAGYERAYSQILAEVGRTIVKDPAQADSEAQKKYLTEIFRLTVASAGPRKLVRFKTRGTVEYACRIAEGTLMRLSEKEFITETLAASASLVNKFNYEMALLKDECFGLNIPELARERQRRRKKAA